MRHAFAVLFLAAVCAALFFGVHAGQWLVYGIDRLPPAPTPELAALHDELPIGRYRELATGDLAPALYVHAGAAGLALVLAPFQLLLGALRLNRGAHRVVGVVYGLCVLMGAPTGLLLAPGAFGGPVASTGFVLSGAAWLLTTGLGVLAVARGDFDGHRAWMARSIALAFGGATFRLWGMLLLALELPPEAAYAFAAWTGWGLNLVVAEIWLRGLDAPARPSLALR